MNESILGQSAISLMDHLGYLGLGIGLMLNTMGFLLPSEVLLPVAGLAVRSGNMSGPVVFVVAVVAQTVGAFASHWIGARGGQPLIRRWGRYVLLSSRDLELAHRWFGRYGRATALVGYCLPLIRGYVGYAAGIAEMPRTPFLAAAFIGSLIWTAALVVLGYRLSGDLPAIERVFRPFSAAIAVIVVAAVGYIIYHRLKEQRT